MIRVLYCEAFPAFDKNRLTYFAVFTLCMYKHLNSFVFVLCLPPHQCGHPLETSELFQQCRLRHLTLTKSFVGLCWVLGSGGALFTDDRASVYWRVSHST